MEVQIQELIDKIKSEGIEKAEQTSGGIIGDAEKKAASIISDAKKEAEKIVASAKQEAGQFEASGKQAIAQAGRDLILNVKSNITKMFDSIINKEISGAMSKDFIEKTLSSIIKSWVDNGAADVTVLLSEADKSALESALTDKLQKEFKGGVVIKGASDIDAGFRISEKEGSAFYDITDQGIADTIKEFLNEKLSECMDAALK